MSKAFSLVELSIVLVILGLLTGGILSGQSLIRASELRGVTTEYQVYQSAINSFRDKYMGYPGDFRDATKFWGRLSADASCVTNSAAGVSTSGVCDGNGDGNLITHNAVSSGGESYENYQFWRQLALAGLVEGSYTGLAGAANGSTALIGENVPKSRLNNAGWSTNRPPIAGDANIYAVQYGNVFYYGAPVSNNLTSGATLRPEEAWNIDTKVDDGRPAYGKVIARNWNNVCAAADNGTHTNTNFEASYKLSDSSLQCSLIFRQIF